MAFDRLMFLDFETSGLSPRTAEIVEVAYIVTDRTGKVVYDEACFKVFPLREVPPEVAKINGYTTEAWAREAVDLERPVAAIDKASKGVALVAHNVVFDYGFLDEAFAAYEGDYCWRGDYHRICTASLAMPLYLAGKIKGVSLSTVAEYFGIKQEGAHRALDDTRTCRAVFLALVEYYAVDHVCGR